MAVLSKGNRVLICLFAQAPNNHKREFEEISGSGETLRMVTRAPRDRIHVGQTCPAVNYERIAIKEVNVGSSPAGGVYARGQQIVELKVTNDDSDRVKELQGRKYVS
ncbi:hypothetical protein [Mycobacterium sp. IS-1496]|uniref:hypothetical protein n=1 Tax=Mycobacterium sp. IS-1496 TaxID=1772284 RepID=UPI0012FB0F0F|nr:hypothetical protein [Mycobacterium sp. IS-1496]